MFRIYFQTNPQRDEVIVIRPHRWGKSIGYDHWPDKSKWLIVHPTANLQRERNTFRAAQLWKVMPVSDLLTLIGTFYSAGITIERPVDEAPRISYSGVGHERLYIEEMPAVPDFVTAIYLQHNSISQ